MLRNLGHKAKNIMITMRLSILSVFISLYVISMVLLIAFTYTRFVSVMTYVSIELMKKTSNAVYTEFMDELKNVQAASRLSAELVRTKVVNPNDQQQLMLYTLNLLRTQLETLPSVQSDYWGNESGSLVLASKEADGSFSSLFINQPKQKIGSSYIHRNLEGKIISSGTYQPGGYDPRVRPWYILAKKERQTTETDVYTMRLVGKGNLGFAVATPVYDDKGNLSGVFGFNLRLDYIRHFIEKLTQHNPGVIFIVTSDGVLVSYPGLVQVKNKHLMDIHTISIPWVVDSFNVYQNTHQSEFIFKTNGKDYIATYVALPLFGKNRWLIANIVPESVFVSRLQKMSLILIGYSLLILFLGIIGISQLVTLLVRPIKNLVRETERIKNFEIEGDSRVISRIKEVVTLSNAIYAMKQGLRSFKKYVPALLVRQLIEAGEDARIGGSKKQLAIFFSDIKDFTTISEYEEPNQLMEHICEYLDELSRIIVSSSGTIDKYIGDSIMAFWGAPLVDGLPCQHAATAALQCIERLNELNIKWQAQKKPVYMTRIGIHIGEAIVGNLGSSERLSYTAIGDSINIASRLESINRHYGTQIMVSDAVYQDIKNQFVLRRVDFVILKGKAKPQFIYELLAKNRSEVSFDLENYVLLFAEAFSAYQQMNWDAAINQFQECIKLYPEDKVAPIFIERCHTFKTHPPSNNWDGAWHFHEK